MNENSDAPSQPLSAGANGHSNAPRPIDARPVGSDRATPGGSAQSANSGIEAWDVIDLLVRHWRLLAFTSLLCAGLAGFAGKKVFGPKYTASAQLIRYTTPGADDFFNSTETMTPDTFAGLLRSPELLRTTAQKLDPPVAPDKLGKSLKIDPDPESDMITVSLAAPTAGGAVDALNLYLNDAVDYTRSLQATQATLVAHAYLKKQVEQMDGDIGSLDNEFRSMAAPAVITNKLGQIKSQLNDLSRDVDAGAAGAALIPAEKARLNQAEGELAGLLGMYTELHPLVQQKESEISALQNKIAQQSTNAPPAVVASAAATGNTLPTATTAELDTIRTKLVALEDGRVQMLNRERQAELYAATPPGMARVFAPATLKSVRRSLRGVKIGVAAVLGWVFGLGGGLFLTTFGELFDARLKTTGDLRRVAKLPVLTSLPDLDNMDAQERSQWAFRTWTLLQGRLSPSAHHGFVCGITSSARGEGRSTWIDFLAEAASLTGFRVLTIATGAPPAEGETPAENGAELTEDSLEQDVAGGGITALATEAFSCPAQVTDELTGPHSKPVVNIPLPGWVWNLERRKQWREALNHWRQIDNLVILVELPPGDVTETVLLGASLPNLLWLARSGKSEAGKTRDQLETLRHARCNLIGAVLNHEVSRSLRKRFPRWIGAIAILAALGTTRLSAQSTNAPLTDLSAVPPAPATTNETETSTNLTFSVTHPWQRGQWEQNFTLGPGDVLNFSIYGQPELTIRDVAIGPDGRVSYLEAAGVIASGLTVDQLRNTMDDALGRYRRAPHVIITPVAYHSKKYYVLGKVNSKGVFVLDRPLTVLEAIARAHGFESGLVDRNIVDLADFSRSFIARHDKRLPLDFEKLFTQGDLSQNMEIEPGDYLYVAPAEMGEVYVLGQVRLPGPTTFMSGKTLIAAITARGGFGEHAYMSKVLVVRGSLTHPQTFVVDTKAILSAQAPDFPLQQKDIVYVSSHPFVRVEELADLAITAFIQSITTTWVSADVVQPLAP